MKAPSTTWLTGRTTLLVSLALACTFCLSAYSHPDFLTSPAKSGIYGQCIQITSSQGNGTQTNACPALVAIYRTNGRLVRLAVTDPVGQFYSFVPPGEYVVRARPRGPWKASVDIVPASVTVVQDELTRLELSNPQPPSEPGTPIDAVVGQNFEIKLKSNATTGYQWQLAGVLNTSMVQFVSKIYISDPPPGPGAVGYGGHEIWTFRPVAPGQTDISLWYKRPWEIGYPPAATTNFTVTITQAN